jgi:trehalose-6-phosphatase
MALERARRLLACDSAIYVGDDETDENAFEAAASSRLLSIRIGATRMRLQRTSRSPTPLRSICPTPLRLAK